MQGITEKRSEKRLVYQWPVRFNLHDSNENIPAQIVDLSSNNIAFLCHSDKKSPQMFEKINTNFAIPYFNQSNFFDTVFVERPGFVQRIDTLSNKIKRVVVKFIEPLLFKPGHQNISKAEIEKRLESKALSLAKAEENNKAFREALAKAEEKVCFYAQAKEKAENRLKAEIAHRYKNETALKIEIEQKLISYIEIAAQAKEKAENESLRRQEAEKRAEFYSTELEKLKIKLLSQIDSEIPYEIETKSQRPQHQNRPAIKEIVMNKVDKFITDRKNKIF